MGADVSTFNTTATPDHSCVTFYSDDQPRPARFVGDLVGIGMIVRRISLGDAGEPDTWEVADMHTCGRDHFAVCAKLPDDSGIGAIVYKCQIEADPCPSPSPDPSTDS